MPNSHSHLFSLATLLESAEARQSEVPSPPPVVATNDSGLIDLIAMQERARKESALTGTTRTPLPMTMSPSSVSLAPSADPSGYELTPPGGAARRSKRLLFGAAAGSLALVALATMFALRGGDVPPPPVAAAPVPIAVVPLVAAAPPTAIAITPATPPVVAAAPPAAAPASKPKKAKSHKAHPGGSKPPPRGQPAAVLSRTCVYT